jgi:histidine ammonia-lyase
VNTGLGTLAGHVIQEADLAELQRRLVLSNAAGTGGLMSERDVRCMMLLKAGGLASGRSGVRPELVDAMLAMLNAGITPCVPVKGSVGASGDLAPLAHVAAALIGGGNAIHEGRVRPASEALGAAGLAPFALAAKEGLALVNGTQASTALAVSGLLAAEAAFAAAIVAGMLSLEAALGQDLAFDPRLHDARGQTGQDMSFHMLPLAPGIAGQDEAADHRRDARTGADVEKQARQSTNRRAMALCSCRSRSISTPTGMPSSTSQRPATMTRSAR